MTARIFRSIMLAVGAVLLASFLIILGCLYDYFGGAQTAQLRDELSLAAVGVETSGLEYLSKLGGDSDRLTWIAADGSVIYDAAAEFGTMENHSDREEVREALQSGEGTSRRYSNTLLEKTIYCAKRLSDGSVLRISISNATMGVLILGMLQPICVILIAVLILAFILASRLSKRIVEPLNKLDLEHPLENQSYDEIAPLLRRINRQNNQITAQFRELEQKKSEFDQITDSMNEGLVLLDSSDRILSINCAAERLFCTDESSIGNDFLTVERGCELSEAIASAKQSGHGELTLERSGRIYQLDISQIDSDSDSIGIVLLSFDITERVEAERTRREFTANVSHELRTPLMAILGSSELLTSGMVKSEDMPRFASHIQNEAGRLLTLIEDIIRLSQLDEGVELPRERVELYEVAADVIEQLGEAANKRKVTLKLDGEGCIVEGVSRLFQEIVYNLTENAIKYNVDGGSVEVIVGSDKTLTVKDTGIGIPPESQSRVFERFYRVDKSHSKEIGGTGLGLSIVKHAVSYLGASIELKSEVGVGTEIYVRFV